MSRVMNFELRDVTANDADFLFELTVDVRRVDADMMGLEGPMWDTFLRTQHNAQRASYASQFPAAHDNIVVAEGEPVGRLLLDRSGAEIRIVDVALLERVRGLGLGGTVLRRVLDEARDAGRSVRLSVLESNPAVRLYERLGFRCVSTHPPYLELEWDPCR